MESNIISTITAISLLGAQMFNQISTEHMLAQKEISLENRYAVKSVSDIFKDNILLNLSYMDGKVTSGQNIDWNKVKEPFKYELILRPNDVFAFHEDVLDQYKGKVIRTTNAHFNYQEGFKFSGLMFGDGVCHLASLMYMVSKEAGLDTLAPTSHDFAQIPDIPKEYGVSIYNLPGSKGSNAQQNLYITNNRQKPVTFKFDYKEDKLKLAVFESDQ